MSVVELGYWAEIIMEKYADCDVIGSALFPITQAAVPSAEHELEMIPLDGHPADCLRRYRPPASCVALGLVSAGWAAPMDGSRVRPSAHPEAKRVVQVVVVARDGDHAARPRMPDHSIIDPGRGGRGRVLDALRTAIRRPAAA
jgi:hypothetical protein